MVVNNQTIINNFGGNDQSYPDNYPAVYPNGTGAHQSGFPVVPGYNSSNLYKISRKLPLNSNVLILEFWEGFYNN